MKIDAKTEVKYNDKYLMVNGAVFKLPIETVTPVMETTTAGERAYRFILNKEPFHSRDFKIVERVYSQVIAALFS